MKFYIIFSSRYFDITTKIWYDKNKAYNLIKNENTFCVRR